MLTEQDLEASEWELLYPATLAKASKLSGFYPGLSKNPSLVTFVGFVKVILSRELEVLDLVKITTAEEVFIERTIVSSTACVLMWIPSVCQSTFQ